jgi:DNA polymerase-3 subunit delta'
MALLQWNRFAGQERIKEVLESAYNNQKLGHAYLLCGEAGTGKFIGALELGMALLCTNKEKTPCYECESCKKVQTYSHPDFHVIMPLFTEKEHKSSDGKLSDEGWNYVSSSVTSRINDPYALRSYAGIPGIPLEWVKEMTHAIVRGPLEGKRNVAILDGIDYMNKESANAMLKTLEEPPPGTLMLLLTERIHAVLPTIISRCQILRFAHLPPDLIADSLSKKYGIDRDDKRIQDVSFSGSLGRSIYMYNNPVEEISKDAAEFWGLCSKQEWSKLSEMISRLSMLDDFSTYEKLFVQVMYLIRNAFFNKLEGTGNYIIGSRSQIVDLGRIVTPEQIEEVNILCGDAIGQIRARANISLVLVNFAIELMEIINGQKQQVS